MDTWNVGKALFSAWIEACTIKGVKIRIGRLKVVRKVVLGRILVLEAFLQILCDSALLCCLGVKTL